jgi:hypothetical protein
MLSVVFNVDMMSVILLNVIMLSVVLPNVMHRLNQLRLFLRIVISFLLGSFVPNHVPALLMVCWNTQIDCYPKAGIESERDNRQTDRQRDEQRGVLGGLPNLMLQNWCMTFIYLFSGGIKIQKNVLFH